MLMLCFSSVGFADPLCQGRFINPITDINWNLIFPITIAGMRVGSGSASPESPLTYLSPICVCPSHIFGIPMPGIEVTFHEPLYIEEIVKHPGCFSSLGGVQLLKGYDEEQTDLKEDSDSSSRWEVHWYKYPLFALLQLFKDFTCVYNGD